MHKKVYGVTFSCTFSVSIRLSFSFSSFSTTECTLSLLSEVVESSSYASACCVS